MVNCNFSTEEVFKLIKESIAANNGKVRRSDMLSYLLTKSGNGQGMSYADATDITDFYFNTVRRKFVSNINAASRLSNLQKTLAKEYFENNQVPISDTELQGLEKIWEQADKALTPTEKSRYNEYAQNIIEQKDKDYNNRIVESLIWIKPLFSIAFTAASIRSNLARISFRGLAEAVSKNGIDFNVLKKSFSIDNQSRLGALETLKGTVPVTNIINFDTHEEALSRVEEFHVKPTSKLKAFYLNSGKGVARYGARAMNSIDVLGTIGNANKIYYSLYKNKLQADNPTWSKDQVEAAAYQHTYETNKVLATQRAIDMFNSLGVLGKGVKEDAAFMKTSRFKLAVEEMSKMDRDEQLMKKSYQYAKEDFWKKRMTVKSDLGFGDTGISGIAAQFAQGASSTINNILSSGKLSFKDEKKKTLVGSVIKQRMFGFLNGAAAFTEDKLEHFLPYGLLKAGILQKQKGSVNEELLAEIQRRQKDMILKGALGIVNAALLVGIKAAIENIVCDDLKDQHFDLGNKFNQGTAFSICGHPLPIVISQQGAIMYETWNAMTEGMGDAGDFFSFVLEEVLGNNRFMQPSVFSQIADNNKKIAQYEENNNTAAADKEKKKRYEKISDAIASFVNSFSPLPDRLIKEIKVTAQPITGQGESQKYMADGLLDQFRHSFVNAMGLSDFTQMLGAGKPVYDYLDRKVWERTGSTVYGGGIKYDNVDGMLARLNIRPPYTDRLTQVTSDVKKSNGEKVTIKRYLSDDEFYNLSKAKSELTKEYFDKNYDRLLNEDEDKSKAEINKFFDGLFANGKKYFEKHDDANIDDIKSFMGTGRKKKKVSVNKTVLQED